MWFDSHCHIHMCESATPAEIFEAAEAAGVEAMVTVGIDVGSSRYSMELTQDERAFACVGVHPNSADEWTPEAHHAIEELLSSPRAVAVGESGLDFYRDHTSPDVQEAAFVDHIGLAKRYDRALVIHTRSSVPAALDVLEREGPPERFVFHCWSADQEQLTRALSLGAYISFAGNVSFKSAHDLRAVAAAVPGDRLLIETDSPFLTPEPQRGKPNEPARVPLVGDAVAAARGVDAAEIARLTTDNARTFFGLA